MIRNPPMSPLVIRDRVGQRQVRAWAAIPPNAELATELRLRGHATGASILGLSENRFSSHDQTHAPSLYRRRAVLSRLSHAMRSWCRVDRVNRLLCNDVSTNTDQSGVESVAEIERCDESRAFSSACTVGSASTLSAT